MKKWKDKKRFWKIRKAQRGNCSKQKTSKKKYQGKQLFNSDISTRETSVEYNTKHYEKDVPTFFSIVDNCEETLAFFKDIITEISAKHFKETFYFNFADVKKITIDAMMYLLAIMGNIHNNNLNQKFTGNQPKNEAVKKNLVESGFYKYVNTNFQCLPPRKNKKIQICNGKKVDEKLSRGICDFVNESCGTDKKFSSELYVMLIELMTNTVQHAYGGDEIWTEHNWYIFIEDKEESIQFFFLDIGEGIPNTVRKNFLEKIMKYFKSSTDAGFIISALDGEFRSQTNLSSRGKGLPSIKQYAERKEVVNFSIISGKGSCRFECDELNNRYITQKTINKSLDGTLFCWEIQKNRINLGGALNGDNNYI